MKLSDILAELNHVYDEFGDVPAELYDSYDMDEFHPLTHVRFDGDRQRVLFLSDR